MFSSTLIQGVTPLAIFLLSLSILFASETLAKPFINSTLFDGGFLGAYPYESFHSTDLIAPRLNIRQWDEECDHGYTLFTPRARSVPHDGPMILDAKGNLVWTEKKYGTADNLQIQTYKNQSYLTFWAGDHDFTRWPGKYYMLDSTYEIKYIITPVGFEYGDLHEFTITESGSALMTIYDPLPWDLSPIGGPVNGWIEDSIIQEVDIETGDLIFEWRASEHFEPNDTYAPIEGFGTSKDNAFDWIHINSIDKDSEGNYFISGRYTCAVAYIDGRSGEVIWTLGGRTTSFEDLSNGAASNFTYQHHARYHGFDELDRSNYSIVISVFDNAKFQRHKSQALQSRGILISLDLAAMTATLIQEFKNPAFHTLSQSQGNMQVMTTPTSTARQSNTLVGWGHSAAWTMFDPTGRILCDVHYGAYAMWYFGWAVSYRIFQFDEQAWTGSPSERPRIAAGVGSGDSSTIYASWNGATVVRSWKLQGTERWTPEIDSDAGRWADVKEMPKTGFEVVFEVDVGQGHSHRLTKVRRHEDEAAVNTFSYFRVLALSSDGEVLAATLPVNLHSKEVVSAASRYSNPLSEPGMRADNALRSISHHLSRLCWLQTLT